MSLASMLSQTARVQRFVKGALDEYGRPEGAWNTIETVMCRIELMFSEEDSSDRTTDFLQYRVFMAPTDITENDRLLLDSLRDTRVMEIVGIDEEWANKGSAHHLVVWGQSQKNQDSSF